jgi:hypothetical protein
MKFDSKIKLNDKNIIEFYDVNSIVDRQLYHVCLLDKEFTEQWVDATNMFIYSVPV